MHGFDLDQCEICARNDFDPTVNNLYPWPGPKDQQKHDKHFLFSLWFHVILLLLREP